MENHYLLYALKKIAILCISESHSDNDQIIKLNSLYGPNLHFLHSHDPLNPRSKGIVIVMNKNNIKSPPSNIHIISPGRTINFDINWPENKKLNISAIYAPNAPNNNTELWNKILTSIENGTTMKPDIIIGDFNMVEDATDRLPPHPDPPLITEALTNLKTKLNLTDGWHCSNPPQTEASPSNNHQEAADQE